MSIIGFLILGLIVGALAKLIVPGGQGGWLAALVLGVVGALLGGWLGSAIFGVGLQEFWSLETWLVALVGAVVVVFIWGLITKNRGAART